MDGFNEEDQSSMKKTFMILTLFDMDSIFEIIDSNDHFSKWACNVGFKYLKVPEFEPIILNYLFTFYQHIDCHRLHGHMNILVEMIKQKTTISDDFDQVFRSFNTNYLFEEETLKELTSDLILKIFQYGDFQFYAIYFSIIKTGQYTPTTEIAKELIENAIENMLKNEGKPWIIEEFDDSMNCKESLDLMSQTMSDNKEFAEDLLGLCERYITLKIENKKYEDWKYITVGIRSFTYFFEYWEEFISPNLETWMNLILSRIDLENDFVKCSVIECIAILCDCLEENIYKYQDLIIEKIPKYINHSTNAVSVLAIRFFNNFFENTDELNPIHIQKIIKDYTEILKNQRDMMYNNSHNEQVIYSILSCFQNFFQSEIPMDISVMGSIIDSIFKSSKFDEIRLKLMCLLVLSLFNFEEESESGIRLNLLRETVNLFNKAPGYTAPDNLLEEIVSVHHKMFGNQYSALIEKFSIEFLKNKHFSKMDEIRNSSHSIDINFIFK
jgi:hypothetical protein